jgi:hypothetical protein
MRVEFLDEEPTEIDLIALSPTGTAMDLDPEKTLSGNSVSIFD